MGVNRERTSEVPTHREVRLKECVREIRVQEAIPSEVCYGPDGVRLRRVVRSDIGIHVIVRL